MENVLTLEELQLLIESKQEAEHREHKFLAAMKGVDLDEHISKENDVFDKVKIKAAADLAGKSEDEFVFNMIGIDVVTEGDEI